MIYMVVLMHAMLMYINYCVSRSLLYPPAAFTCLWAVMLSLLALSGNFFYPVSDYTLLIFTLGSLAFSMGGFFSETSLINQCRRSCATYSYRRVAWLLDKTIWLLILMIPFYFKRLHELSALSGVDDFWMGIRTQTSSGQKDSVGFGLFGYLIALANFSSIAALSECIRASYSKRKTALIILLTFSYGMTTAARTGTITLLLSLICTLLLYGKFKARTAFLFSASFLFLFSAPAILLGKGGNVDASFSENMEGVIHSLQIYTLAGLVAFDQTVLHPGSIPSNNSTFMFFFSLLKALGFDVKTVSPILDYTSTPVPTNVYSVYFPYYSDMGLIGLVCIMFVLGAALSFFYRRAVSARPEFIVLYSLGFASLMLTCFVEAFFTALSYWIQATIFSFVLYNMPSLGIVKNRHRFP